MPRQRDAGVGVARIEQRQDRREQRGARQQHQPRATADYLEYRSIIEGQAAAMAADIDVDLVWETAPDEEFGFDDLAREYFSATASAVEQAAMLMRLFETPHYFHRRGKGRFRKAPEDILKQALVAIERKKQQALQIAEWAQALSQGQCPQPIKDELYKILFKPSVPVQVRSDFDTSR